MKAIVQDQRIKASSEVSKKRFEEILIRELLEAARKLDWMDK